MSNSNCLAGMRCPNPECHSEGPFYMDVIERVLMHDDGSEAAGGDQEWVTDRPAVECVACHRRGRVSDFEEQPSLRTFTVILVYDETDDDPAVRLYIGEPVRATDPKAAIVAALAEAPETCGGWADVAVIEGDHPDIGPGSRALLEAQNA